jgi:hypothetical protein
VKIERPQTNVEQSFAGNVNRGQSRPKADMAALKNEFVHGIGLGKQISGKAGKVYSDAKEVIKDTDEHS